MSNLNQKIYFLSLQKFLPFDELISFLNLTKEDVISLTEKYSRVYCEEQEKYFDDIIAKKFILMPEVLNFILSNRSNKKFRLNDILKEFKVEKSYLINFLYYLIKIQPKLAIILYINDNFLEEVKEEIKKSAIERLTTEIKLFRNSKERTSQLIENAQEKSIEELSLMFGCSPFIVEEELTHLGKGGFWNNENIRKNYPFFIGSNEKCFSKVEILYLINNKFLDRAILADRVKTSVKSLEEFYKILETINLKEEIIIKFVLSDEFFLSNEWLKVNTLVNLKKDNSSYLFNYSFKDLFEEKELKDFLEIKDNYSLKFSKIENELKNFESSNYLFVTNLGNKYLGRIIYENDSYKAIREAANDNTILLDNKEIFLYKKLKA